MASQQQHKRAVKVRKIASLKLSSAVKVRKMGLVLGAYKNLDLYLYCAAYVRASLKKFARVRYHQEVCGVDRWASSLHTRSARSLNSSV